MSIFLAWRMAGLATVLTAFGSASLLAQTVAKEQAPMRIAVVCDREIVEGDQMLSYLTERGYDLLERTDLALIVKEGRLTREMLSGDLARADALVVIEVVSVLEDDFLATRVVVCKDGRIHGSDLRLREDAGRALCGVVDGQLRDFQRRVKKVEEERLRVSVQAVREEYEAGRTENPLLGRALADMVVSGLSEQPQIEVLERGDLGLVQFERLLTPIDGDTFAVADRVVTATFKREKGSARVVIQVAGTQGGANLEESATIESDEYPGIAEAIVERALPLILRGSSEGGADLRIRRFRGSKEAERFAEEAERALRLGLHDHAAEFAETAYLLDDDDAGNHLYLMATAELLAAMPGLRGRGLEVDRGFGFQSGPSGAPERIDLISEMVDGRDYEEFPLPDERQWEVIALSAERSADLVNRARRDNGSLDGTKALYFRGSLTPLLNEVVMNSFVRYRQGIPGHEREMLQRIADAVWRPSEGPGTPVQRLPLDFLRSPYDVLILESSREAAVGTIRHWLYGPHLSELATEEGPKTLDLRERVEHLRRMCFGVFECEGYDSENGDMPSSVIDDRILGTPFVAWLSGSGMTFAEAFATAIEEAPEAYQALARCDALWAKAAAQKRGAGRDATISELRQTIRESFDPLREVGLLDFFIESFLHFEEGRYNGEEDLGEFWREAHAAVYADNRMTPGRITELLIDKFNGERWGKVSDENPARYVDFLASLEADLKGNQNGGLEHLRVSGLKSIAEARQLIGRGAPLPSSNDAYALGTLTDIPESETFVVKWAVYGYDTPTLATFVGEDAIYQFQHGNASLDEPSVVVRIVPGKTFEEINIPDEVRETVDRSADIDLVKRIQRIGAMNVGEDRIALAYPGGLANYDRRSKTWNVTPVPFFKNRSGLAYVGERIISHVGSPPLPTGPAPTQVYMVASPNGGQGLMIGAGPYQSPPVSGLYATGPGSERHVAIVDSTRVPPRNVFDSASVLRFSFPPLATQGDCFLIGMAADVAPQRVYKIDLLNDAGGGPSTPIALPFEPGARSVLGGTKADGYSLVSAAAKRRIDSFAKESEWKLEIGAFAVGPDGKYHWLLDTGAILEGKGSTGSRAGPILTNGEKPIHLFPDRFAVHRGLFTPAPVLHYDGSRLLMLTSQLTTDGRRILYVWADRNTSEPKRIGLRFDAFKQKENQEMDEEERVRWNRDGRNEIFSMTTWNDFLLLEYRRGFFFLRLDDLEQALNK